MKPDFNEMTASFFDELSAALAEKLKDRDEEVQRRPDRPYSNLLTQDEEPMEDHNPQQMEEQEPEIITRGSS